MISAGITSLKIEGRRKGIHYLATTVKAYREAIDRYLADDTEFQHAETGHKPVFVGKVIDQPAPRDTRIEVRNKLFRDEQIEILRHN